MLLLLLSTDMEDDCPKTPTETLLLFMFVEGRGVPPGGDFGGVRFPEVVEASGGMEVVVLFRLLVVEEFFCCDRLFDEGGV